MYVHLEEVMVLHLMYDKSWLIRPILQERTLYRQKKFGALSPLPFSAPPKIALLTVKIYILLGLSYIKRSSIECTFRISFKKSARKISIHLSKNFSITSKKFVYNFKINQCTCEKISVYLPENSRTPASKFVKINTINCFFS